MYSQSLEHRTGIIVQQKLLPAIARLRKAGGSILAHAHAMAVSPCNKAPRLCRSGIRKHKVRGIQPIAVLIKPASLYHRPANGDAQAIARLGIIDRIGQPTGGIVSTGGDASLFSILSFMRDRLIVFVLSCQAAPKAFSYGLDTLIR